MDLSGYSVSELIGMYSSSIKELKNRGILRTKNVVGELGGYLVLDLYNKSPELPTLTALPLNTKNINAISLDGERYSIKSTTGSVTGVFYGLEPLGSSKKDKQIFDYVVVCKMDEDYELEGVYQLDWQTFEKHKKWHSRMKAWNLSLSNSMKSDSVTVYEKNKTPITTKADTRKHTLLEENSYDPNEDMVPVTVWNKTEKVDHTAVAEKVALSLGRKLGKHFNKQKDARQRFVSNDNDEVLCILSATYSQKNKEYWYSINDETIPWMELYPVRHIAFSLGSEKNVLLFNLDELKEMFEGCLKTKEDESKGKKSHYHISFAVEDNGRVYFKKKKPTRDYIDVTSKLIKW